MARELGSPFWLLVVWVIVGITAITCALAVTLAYVLISMVFIYLVPFGQIASDETLMAQAGDRLFGVTGGAIMTGIVALLLAERNPFQVMLGLGVVMLGVPAFELVRK
jgi:hypothetical protein